MIIVAQEFTDCINADKLERVYIAYNKTKNGKPQRDTLVTVYAVYGRANMPENSAAAAIGRYKNFDEAQNMMRKLAQAYERGDSVFYMP